MTKIAASGARAVDRELSGETKYFILEITKGRYEGEGERCWRDARLRLFGPRSSWRTGVGITS